jgi:hypothetical protein
MVLVTLQGEGLSQRWLNEEAKGALSDALSGLGVRVPCD